MKYVALLRGINVGGNNKISMKQLVAAMNASGFERVSTYINSGNLFFSSDKNELELREELEKLINEEFCLSIRVLVRTKQNINDLADSIPPEWKNNSEMKCDVMFLWDEFNNDSVLKQLYIKPGIDEVRYSHGALIWKVERKDVAKSAMMKLIGTELYANMTIRNCNTVRKIKELLNTQ